MGNGMCSRKQKRIFQTLLLLTVVFGFLYGAMLYYELQTQLRKAEAVALKYQQHQESLSAQLQGTAGGAPGSGDVTPAPPSSPGRGLRGRSRRGRPSCRVRLRGPGARGPGAGGALCTRLGPELEKRGCSAGTPPAVLSFFFFLSLK